MKKLFKAIILSALIVSISSCSDDDFSISDHLSLEQGIIGKWAIRGLAIDGGDLEDYQHPCITSKNYQEFTANGIATMVGYNQGCGNDYTYNSSYTITGSVLTLVDENDPVADVFTIVSLTSFELVLKRIINTPNGEHTIVTYYTRL